jgi:hypothetical protein
MAIERISIPVTCHTTRENGHDKFYGWLLNLDGPSADISYTETQLKKSLRTKAIEAIESYHASEQNSCQRMIMATNGTVFFVQFRYGAWGYYIAHAQSDYAGSTWGRKSLSSCRQTNYVFDDIENSISSPINENNISFENDSLPIVR